MEHREISKLRLIEEAELQRKLPKNDEDVLASVPGDLQLLVMSDEEEEPVASVQPIREEHSDPVPWFWCRGNLGPSQSLSRGAFFGRSRGRLSSGGSFSVAVSPGRSWSRGRPRGRSRGRAGCGETSLCRFCGRGFKFRSALEMHMRSHTGERPYTCTFCGRGFSLKGNLKTHLKTHLNGSERSEDLNRFILDRNRTSSLTPMQSPPPTPMQSPPPTPMQSPPLTPMQSPPQTPLQTPPPTPLTPPQTPFQTCSWSQSPVYSRLEARPEAKPLQCPVCSKTFSWKSTLSVHMRVHTGERPYSCTLCDRRFSLKGNLKDHMRRHLLDKRHLCTFCGLGFDHESLLLSHLAIHTTREEEQSVHEEGVHKGSVPENKRHICPFCSLGFDQEHLYFSHLTVHTAGDGGMQEQSVNEEDGMHTSTEDKQLICPFCGLHFEHKSLLLDHITVHTSGEEEEDAGEDDVHENWTVHKGQGPEHGNDDDDDDDDDNDGEEEVYFAITVQ